MRLTIGQGVVANVVRRRVAKVPDQRRNTGGRVLYAGVLRNLEPLEGDGHGDEAETHERRGQHEHIAALEPGHDEGDDGGVGEAPARVRDVNARLDRLFGVAHHVEEDAGVVADEGVSGELRKEADEDCDVDTAAHAGGADNVHPGLLGCLHFGLDGLADLGNLGFDEEGVGVALGVVLHEDGGSFFVAIVGHEETGGLGEDAVVNVRLLTCRGGRLGRLGTYKTVQIWSSEGQIWRREGRRQAQSLSIFSVPMAIADARI